MDEQDKLINTIASRWFWVAVAFFLLIQFGDWIKVPWIWGVLLAALIALFNVAIFFGLSAWVLSKVRLSPNIFVSAVLLIVANMATLAVLSLFLPNDFKGIGDYFIGAIMMVLLVGAAQSIPRIFQPWN